jgi:hypothetical protein
VRVTIVRRAIVSRSIAVPSSIDGRRCDHVPVRRESGGARACERVARGITAAGS